MRLGDICTKIGSGATPRGGQESYKSSGIPIIRSQNVLDWSFKDDGLAYIDGVQADALANVEVLPGDVLLNITGDSVARACMVPAEQTPARVNQHVAIVRHGDKLSPTYLLAFLQSIKPHLLSLASSGATRKALTKAMIENLEIELPDIETQNRISWLIDCVQQKIMLNARANGYLAETCDVLYSSYTAGEQAADWPMGTLKDLLEIRYGKDHKQLNDGDVPVYGSGGYMRSVERFLFNGESVLIPRKGSLNNVMYVSEKFWTVDTMFYAVPIIPNAAKYAYQFIKRLDLASMNSGSAVPSMTTKILNALPVPIPPKESLYDFDGQLQPYYSKIRANTIENEWLAALRDALLPKLMSGEIDVSEVDLTSPNSHLYDY